MKFNFIIPSWSYWTEPTRAQPLTQLYLATILEEEGHKVNFVDFRDGKKKIPKADANFYTVASPDFEEVKGIMKENPGLNIGGGPHANIFPDECIKFFDAVCVGRGEESIKQIARDIEYGKLRLCYNIPAKGEYPFPRRDFLPKEKIVTSLFKTEDIPSTTVLFAHGCPFNCSFCANYNRSKIENRSLESISKEIDYLKENYGIKGLSLQDEICIPLNEEYAYKFLDLLKSKDIVWRGQLRAGIKSDIAKKARESGCIELSIGLESVCQETVDCANKGIKVDTVKQSLRICRENGIKTRVYLLNGLPKEPENIVQMTKDFINETNPDVVLLSTLQPYPGSDIYNNPEKYHIKSIDKHYEKYNHLRLRFKDSKDKIEDVVPFEYEEGYGFSKKRIIENLLELQSFLRDRGVNK